ncbi:hypothetical protein F7725_021097 [Dissostichus mawsoni]|uniref:Uncharacterized protein n=1 Tax=Dissostichus mawsoni TaxID=36200 RepID=A0A7J5YH05_DISMA|nr:hypothetical protein F7725_021097 [Dissostichus mawsoni]
MFLSFLLSSSTICFPNVFSSRLQRLAQVLWPVSAREPGRAHVLNNSDLARSCCSSTGPRQHRRLDGRRGGAVCPWWPRGLCSPASSHHSSRGSARGTGCGTRTRACSPGLREALSTSTISRIICDNTGISSVPTDAFGIHNNAS